MTRRVRQSGGFDGARLIEARKRIGLTRAELARRLETGWEVVSQWETGECQPRPRSIPEIAAAVGVDTTDLYRPDQGKTPLAARRVAAGLNQADVANALGVSRATVSQWERGHRPVPEKYCRAYRHLLGIAGDDVICSDGHDADSDARTPNTTEAERNEGSSGPKTTSAGSAARVAHLIVVTELEYSGGVFQDQSGRPKNWRVYSPQGIDVNKTGTPELGALMDEAALRLARLGYRQLCIHHEQRIIIDDEPERVVRFQTSPPSNAREYRAKVFLSAFTPEFYVEGIGEDLEEKARIRKEFESIFPRSVTGETVFVIAQSTDTYGWLQDQTIPYIPYTIVAHLPEAEKHFFAGVHFDNVTAQTDGAAVSTAALGIDRDTTVGEIAERLERYRTAGA